MAVVASGSVSNAEDAVMDTLAALSAVQTFFGVETEELARAKLINDEVPTGTARPFATCYMDPDGGGFDTESDGFGVWHQRGEVRVLFEREVPEAYESNVAQAELDVKNHAGAIIDALIGVAGDGGEINATRVRMFGPWRFDDNWEESALGQIQVFGLLIDWVS